MQLFYSITEAAKKLGISRQAVHYRIKRGLIDAQKVGRTWVIPKDKLK